ncbi:hypothetical protein GYH30_026266 [Glycine max]|nr:hypothetical protein GYH30_026266 [Glycine max]
MVALFFFLLVHLIPVVYCRRICHGQPGKWFMLAPLLVLDVFMDFDVFILGRHIYFFLLVFVLMFRV